MCFARFRRRWDPKGSVINAFATFLLLSYSKLLTESYSLLNASTLHNSRGETVGPAVLYYDASIESFSTEHLPFALLAICVLLVFAVFPLLLLLLYPMRSFQRCLGYCTGRRWQFLHTFADAFQGCYKNGTNGAHDYRYFAGLYLFCRIVLLAALAYYDTYIWLILISLPVVGSLLFAYFRPYKKNFFNTIDCLVCALLALAVYGRLPVQLLYALGLIPFLYFISFILYTILFQIAPFRTCWNRIVDRLRTKNKNLYPYLQRDNNVDEDLPDRIVNPDMYQPLLQATNSGTKGSSQDDTQPQADLNGLVAYGST